MNIVVISPTPPYNSGLSYYTLYLYSNFSKHHIIQIEIAIFMDIIIYLS